MALRLRFAAALLVGAIAPALSVSLSSSCSLGGIATGGAGGDSSSAQSSSSSGTGGSAGHGGAGGAVQSSSSTGPPPTSCPSGMTRLKLLRSEFCVDDTEVTNEAYAKFADQMNMPTTGTVCAWKTSHAPAVKAEDTGPRYPVLGVDWCDAFAYCAFVGKRLCGAVGGGAIDTESLNSTRDQWFDACSHEGALIYPYGTTDVDLDRCSDCDPDAGCDPTETRKADAALEVGAATACQGGFAGIYDMSGNAWEWEDACDDEGVGGDGKKNHAYDHCYRRGGGYDTPHTVVDGGPGTIQDKCLGCAYCSTGKSLRKSRNAANGIRCCLDLASP